MKRGLLLAFICIATDIFSVTDNVLQEQNIKVGAWSRFKQATYNVARMPVDATSWCVSKTCYYTKQAAFFVYKTADTMVYVVGLTTTGFLIYCYCNGKLEKVVTVDGHHYQYWWQLTGIPFFKEINIGLPEYMVKLEEKIRVTVQALHGMEKSLRGKASDVFDAAKGAYLPGTQEVLMQTGQTFVETADGITDIAENLAQ